VSLPILAAAAAAAGDDGEGRIKHALSPHKERGLQNARQCRLRRGMLQQQAVEEVEGEELELCRAFCVSICTFVLVKQVN
jgi:hypothetical protein